MTQTIFQKLRKFRETPKRWPKEDQLTEAFAVVLNSCPEVARQIVRLFSGESPPEDAEVVANTQVRVARGFVDLELVVGPVAHGSVVWIECKVDSPARRKQGTGYTDCFKTEHPHRSHSFGWLLKAGETVIGGPPSGADVVSWQEVAEVLQRWLQGVDESDQLRLYGPRLVKDFVIHLEEELAIVALKPFTPKDAEAYQGHKDAIARFEGLIHDAVALVRCEREWGENGPPAELVDLWLVDKVDWNLGSVFGSMFAFKNDQAKTDAGAQSWLELVVDRDEKRRESPAGDLIVGVGLVHKTPGGADLLGDAVVEKLRSQGFEYGSLGDPWVAVMSFLTVLDMANKLDSHKTRAKQAESLAAWVEEEFSKVEEALAGGGGPGLEGFGVPLG